MCIIPTHEIGLFNVWLFFIPVFLSWIIPYIVNKEAVKRMGDMSWWNSKEKKLYGCSSLLLYGSVIYSIWVPLQIETVWFYIGLVIFIIGFIGELIAYKNFASTPLDEPITKGIYKISRNPLYFFFYLVLIGGFIASLSWIMLLLTILYVSFVHQIILSEERHLLEIYGESYRKYKEKVPRYFLFF